jgi:hypothetical protein
MALTYSLVSCVQDERQVRFNVLLRDNRGVESDRRGTPHFCRSGRRCGSQKLSFDPDALARWGSQPGNGGF